MARWRLYVVASTLLAYSVFSLSPQYASLVSADGHCGRVMSQRPQRAQIQIGILWLHLLVAGDDDPDAAGSSGAIAQASPDDDDQFIIVMRKRAIVRAKDVGNPDLQPVVLNAADALQQPRHFNLHSEHASLNHLHRLPDGYSTGKGGLSPPSAIV